MGVRSPKEMPDPLLRRPASGRIPDRSRVGACSPRDAKRMTSRIPPLPSHPGAAIRHDRCQKRERHPDVKDALPWLIHGALRTRGEG